MNEWLWRSSVKQKIYALRRATQACPLKRKSLRAAARVAAPQNFRGQASVAK
jgi:hypothetical protein